MNEQVQHEMQLSTTYSSGAEEWYCPICGRRVVMQWPPHYKKVILEPGDKNALHSGSRGGLHVGATPLDSREQAEAPIEVDLSCWEGWLADVNLDDLGVQ